MPYSAAVHAGAIVIVGAGPCGIACARELVGRGHDDVVVLERADHPGGLASSVVDANGFTWDLGGHVVFSHYGEFDRLLAETMGDDVEHHDRSSYVRVADRWVPYPFQNNLHRLPPVLADEAVAGLRAAQHDGAPPAGADFGSWMRATFGDGICRLFMQPYNEKVWAHPASMMAAGWIAERVSVVDWQEVAARVERGEDDTAWGPNNRFAFPACGGTGEIYRRAAAPLADHVRYRAEVLTVDAAARTLTLGDGDIVAYDRLVWTGPLDVLVARLTAAPDLVRRAATELVHNSVTMVGIGYERPTTDDRSWFYFPEPDVPFYRATNFGKYARANVPGGRTDHYCSWMTEIASSEWRPLERDALVERVDDALRRVGLVDADAPVASAHVEHIPYAYPVPTLGRDAALGTIQPWLAERDIIARGRFGAWRYELGNMDHAVKMGVDVAARLLDDDVEEAWS